MQSVGYVNAFHNCKNVRLPNKTVE